MSKLPVSWPCSHIALELPNTVVLVGGLHRWSLALNDYLSVFLVMFGLGRQDDEIGPRFAATNTQRELNLDVDLGVAVFAHKRLSYFLTNLFLWSFETLGLPIDEVEYLPLLHDDRAYTDVCIAHGIRSFWGKENTLKSSTCRRG